MAFGLVGSSPTRGTITIISYRGLAQLVERAVWDREVEGSSPLSPTMNDCIFCKIVKGEIPAAKIWEDESFLAFLSIQPINPGHTLVIPKKHVPYIFDLDDQTLGDLIVKCKPIARALKEIFKPASGKIGVMVMGGEVPHVHVHLVPMEEESDLRKLPQSVSFEQLEKEAAEIRKALS